MATFRLLPIVRWVFASAMCMCALQAQEQGGVSAGNGGATEKKVQTPGNQKALFGPIVSIPVLGLPIGVQVAAAPDQTERLLICTSEVDAPRARRFSAAYVSLDRGNTWMKTALDASSDWVSEASCAAGAGGSAYFAASASDTSDGMPHHERGTTGVYRSVDGGITWNTPRRFPFVDWTALAVLPPDSGHDGVYLFGNTQAVGGTMSGQRRPLLASDDGVVFSDPRFPAGEMPSGNFGSFPLGVASLDRSTMLVLFAGASDSSTKERRYTAYRVSHQEYAKVSEITLPAGLRAELILNGHMAADESGKFRGRIYVAFPARENNQHVLALAFSDDHAKTWSVKVVLRQTNPAEQWNPDGYAGIAVNRNGIVGMEWHPPNGCPTFSLSEDGGASVSETHNLGSCDQGGAGKLPAAVVAHMVGYDIRAEIAHPMQATASGPPGFTFRLMNTTLAYGAQVVADAGGSFHAFWTEAQQDGTPVLLTTTVTPGGGDAGKVYPAGEDVTAESLVRVLGEKFDPYAATFSIEAAVENIGRGPIAYPSALQVTADRSDCGQVKYLNPSGSSTDGLPVFRISPKPDREHLYPGEQTLPVHFEIQVAGCDAGHGSLMTPSHRTAGDWFYPLAVRFKVFVDPPNPRLDGRPH